ncbi:TraB/GumN family protein [candidate division KSB1 bacterium]|nr:TraB/GumN family protein [candidate division KSB1 bacterium]
MYPEKNKLATISIIVIVLLLLAGCAKRATQNPTSNSTTSLWKVESPTTSVYLLGSIHVLKESDYPLPPAMDKAFNEAQHLFFEVHLDSADSPMAQAKILLRSFLRGDSTLADCIHDTLLQMVHDQADTLGVQPTMFNKMRPWMVSMTLALLKMNRSGIQPQFGVDFYFFKKARLERKQVSGLETVEFQADLLGNLSSLNQAEYLQFTLNDLDRLDLELGTMTAAWRTGDVETLETLLVEGFTDYPEIYNTMVVNRNQKWMRRIRNSLAAESPSLFIVGVAHLVGEDGVIHLLEKEGYKIQQL